MVCACFYDIGIGMVCACCYDENDNLIDTIYFTDTLGDKQGIGGENVLSSTVNESVRKMKFSKAFLADLNEVQLYN